jgi:hypothetical protein
MVKARKRESELTLKTATIRCERLTQPVVCAVLNSSQGEACILVASTKGYPDDFELTMDVDGATHVCRVVWRTETRLGVSFRQGLGGAERVGRIVEGG